MPVALIGANVNGIPNFETLAYVGIIEANPPMISISSWETHYTNIGIKENGRFSVNTPSEEIVGLVDYVGIVSGKLVEVEQGHEIFIGKIVNAYANK
ncbi:MAG: flavin reductase family protein [Candidatus Thorarchaeota archaeon]